ncbi:hypothetical protein QC762_706085 [Podospora pseudocomata]|uniref:Uncharacterized protein n=1 Tax=Podospora pseudocomata TaxID=2093779 RepID=A0ABR0G3J2_9PEZI|nr:hypothetical protein QC762_706085 [Podospora pseudocomata]
MRKALSKTYFVPAFIVDVVSAYECDGSLLRFSFFSLHLNSHHKINRYGWLFYAMLVILSARGEWIYLCHCFLLEPDRVRMVFVDW